MELRINSFQGWRYLIRRDLNEKYHKAKTIGMNLVPVKVLCSECVWFLKKS